MAYVPNAGPYSKAVLTPDMMFPPAEAFSTQAAQHRAQAALLESQYEQRRTASNLREASYQSRNAEEMHLHNRMLENQIRQVREHAIGAAKTLDQMADLVRNIDAEQQNLDFKANKEIGDAKTVAEKSSLLAANQSYARYLTSRAEAHGANLAAQYEREHGLLLDSQTKALGSAPTPIAPAPNQSPGVATPLDTKRHKNWGDDPDKSPTQKREEWSKEGEPAPGRQGDQISKEKVGVGEAAGKSLWAKEGEPSTAIGQTPTPLTSPRTSVPSPLSGGGMSPSGSGMSGGGMGSGMGSNPLSHMMGGLGSNPAQGLTGMPNSASSMSGATNAGGLSNPGAAFARGFSSSAGSVVPNTPIQSTSGAGQLASGSGAGPVTGATQSTGAIQAAAGSGMHAASTPAQTAATGPGAPLGLMPSTGMGAPAAAGAGAGGQVIPAGSSSTTTTSGSTAGGAAPVGGNAGATLVPAGVVSAAAGARPQRRLSPDAEAAAALAWQLQHACRKVGYPVDWAVGVFRSEAGTETVVMSSEGSGYVPAGVYLPRSARLLVSDALVDKVFRDRWFGWPDPAQVLVEYSRLRQDSGWELVAAATNGPVDALKNSGVEYADSCTADRSPLTMEMAAPVLDDLHVHRLQLEYPDLFDRLNRLAGAESAYVERILMPISSELIWGVRGQEYPVELRKVWDILTAGKSPAPELWAEYASVAATDFLTATVLRPDVAGGPEEMKCKLYRDAWVVSRALENIAGWAAGSPLPVADMVYAAAATDPGADIREKVLVALVDVETELGWR